MTMLSEQLQAKLKAENKVQRGLDCIAPAPSANFFFLYEGSDKRAYCTDLEVNIPSKVDYVRVNVAKVTAEMVFIAIDKCLIKDSDSWDKKRCDLALSKQTKLALVDLKLSTQNAFPELRTALSFHGQMKDTLEYFQNHLGISLSGYDIHLFIVFPTATSTTTMGAELFSFENDFDSLSLSVEYHLVPDSPSSGLVPVLELPF